MLGRAAWLGSANRARAANWAARLNRAEPEQQGHATKQAEPSMQATEPSPSGPSARFAWFDYSPASIPLHTYSHQLPLHTIYLFVSVLPLADVSGGQGGYLSQSIEGDYSLDGFGTRIGAEATAPVDEIAWGLEVWEGGSLDRTFGEGGL